MPNAGKRASRSSEATAAAGGDAMDMETTTAATAVADTASINEQGGPVAISSNEEIGAEDANMFNEEDLRELGINQSYEPPKHYVNRHLFGGAITMDVPKTWLDMADFGPVPDNQEIFESSKNRYSAVLSLELLEQQTQVSNERAADYFYADLAGSLGFSSWDKIRLFDFFPDETPGMARSAALKQQGDDVVHMSGGLGVHTNVPVPRRRQDDDDGDTHTHDAIISLRVDLAVFRLFQQETDLLLTLQTPLKNPDPLLPQAMAPILKRAVESLTIRDWGLFVTGGGEAQAATAPGAAAGAD